MVVQDHDSYSSLHTFLTTIMSFLKKEQQFADKDIQNTIFLDVKTAAPLPHITDAYDFVDAIHALYDLISKVLSFRNQEDDTKLHTFMTSLVDCIVRSKQISYDQAVDGLLSFVSQSFLKNISTDGVADLDPRGALLLLKLSGIVPDTFKFSSPVGRGKISNHTTFDSGNTWFLLDVDGYGPLTYETMDQMSLFLQQTTLDEQAILDRQEHVLLSSRFVLDHHHRYCQSTSITHMMYVMLLALKKLSPDDTALQRFVTFIDMSDDMYYQLASMDRRISLSSLSGIQRELIYHKLADIDDMYALFTNDLSFSGLEPLSDQQLDTLSHGKLALCKNTIQAKFTELQTGNAKFLTLKEAHTFYHHTHAFLWLIQQTIPRILDVTTMHDYGLLQLNQKTGEIKIHNASGFDEKFLASLQHPTIKVMKGRNIFIKANEEIPDEVIEKSLTDLGCPVAIVKNMISARKEIIKNKKRY